VQRQREKENQEFGDYKGARCTGVSWKREVGGGVVVGNAGPNKKKGIELKGIKRGGRI